MIELKAHWMLSHLLAVFPDGTTLHTFYFRGRGLDMTYRRLSADWLLTP